MCNPYSAAQTKASEDHVSGGRVVNFKKNTYKIIHYNYFKREIFMKKLLCIIFIISCFSLTAYADYPVIPESVVAECKIRFGVDDTGSRLLYEKINMGGDKYAWMLGWFWSDYKIVVGITDESDIVYYNRAPLGEEPEKTAVITPDEGLEIAENFLKKSVSKPNLTLISGKAYTYKFAEYYHGIRVISHDATVVVDKALGEVSYYKGFGSTDTGYNFMDGLISKDYAYNIYFDKIGFELVYSCKYSDDRRVKTARPMYIPNKLKNRAVDAENGNVVNIFMTDYNYYYNDLYYDGKYFRDNNISTDLGTFEKDSLADSSNSSYITNLVPSLKKGYIFKVMNGTFDYDGGTSVPAYQIDFVPSGYDTHIDGFINDYDKNIFDNIYKTDTELEFLYGRAYISAASGKIIKYDAVKNPKREKASEQPKDIPSRVNDILKFGTVNADKVKYFGDFYENEKTLVFCFARYENGVRAIGEGTLIKYDIDLNEITYLCENAVITKFPTVEYVRSAAEIANAEKGNMPFGICYVDGADGRKTAVYDILDNNAAFDPVTGNRIDLTDIGDTSTLFVCAIDSTEYTVNGVKKTGPKPVIAGGTVYLPFRFVAENNGYEVSYKNNFVFAESNNDVIYFSLSSDTYYVNGKGSRLPRSVMIGGTAYVSLSSVNALFGLHSNWDEETNSIFI